MHGFDDRPRRTLPERRAGHHGGQFPDDVDALLREQLGSGRQQLRRLIYGPHHPDALAVVAAARRLDDQWPAHLGTEVPKRRHIRQRRPSRAGDPELGEARPHRRLVLGEAQRLGAGVHRDPLRGQRCNVLVRHVLVIPRHNVTPGREAAQVVDGAVIADEVRQRGEKNLNIGYDANTGDYTDMFKAGIVDPTRVTRSALQNAASIAGLMLTTEVMITKIEEDEPANKVSGAVR